MSVRKEHSALPSEYLELTEGFLETKRSELGPEVRAYPDWHPLAYNAGVAEDLMKTQPGLVSVRFFKNALFVVSVGKEVAASEDDNDFGLLQKGAAFWCQIVEERSQVASGIEVLHLLLLKCRWPAGMDANARIPERVALSAALREFGERTLAVGAEWFTAQGWDAVEGNLLGVALDGGPSPFVTAQTGRLIRSVWAGIGGALMTADAAGAEKH